MTDTPMRERQADLLGDRYVLEERIGRGGMADVYRAHDRELGRPVAVKVMRQRAAGTSGRARFADEARALARLNHPALVKVLDAATSDDEPYLVMELIDGVPLSERCDEVALDPGRVTVIGAQLADAVAHAHAAGVIHRDLKPGNVLLTRDDRALLTDFGVARLMSETSRHTTTGVTLGTAAYLAPEQVRGEAVTPASDVYSLGLLLLEALTGQRAYRGFPAEAAIARLTTPPAIPAWLSDPWPDLLRAMTSLQPEDRPSAREVAATLRCVVAGVDPAGATAALPAGPPRRRRMRRLTARAWQYAAGALLAALLSVAVSSSIAGARPSQRPDVPDDVPPHLAESLRGLHEAVEG